MALDESEDPMFAYASDDTSTSWSVHLIRWDSCTGQFGTPILVALRQLARRVDRL
jgi:hypothetical protein